MSKIVFGLFCLYMPIFGISKEKIMSVKAVSNPFHYDLGLKVMPSKKKDAVMVCCHGYGHSNKIGDVVRSFNVIDDHIVSFNFPDYNCMERQIDPTSFSFGTINEILPLLFVIQSCMNSGADQINLYGFSAGGGAIINLVAILNRDTYDKELKNIGIDTSVKKKMLELLSKSAIILDCPLKSVEEIIDMRGKSPELEIMAKNYAKNNMRPLDAIDKIKGLKLNILLHFQQPDEILGNRDDQLFADRLQAANNGLTDVVMGKEGGHNTYHASLWKHYPYFLKKVAV